mgnify:FL=1
MRKFKKIISLLLTAAVVFLSACSGKTAGKSASSGGGTGKSAQKVELSFYNDYTAQNRASDDNARLFYDMMRQFEKENPTIKLDVTEISQDNYSNKIQAQNAGGDLPDVFFLKGSWVQSFIRNGSVAPLTDALNQSGIKDKYRQGIFDPVTSGGKIYGMPTQYSVTCLVFYNSNLWKSIGYEQFPDKWDDVLAASKKFKAKGTPATIALGNKDKWPFESTILSCLGDRFTGTDWTRSIIARDGKSKFTDDGFVKALQFSQKLAKSGLFNADYNAITDEQASTLYCQGKAAAVIDGFWDVSYINANASDEVKKATKLALLPAVEGGKGDTKATSGGAGWFIAENSSLEGEKKKAAEKFIMAMTGEEYSKNLTAKYGLIGPVNVGKTDTSKFSNVTQDYVNLINGGVTLTPIYDIQMDSTVIDVMNTGLQDLLNGSVQPADLAKQIQDAQDKAGAK